MSNNKIINEMWNQMGKSGRASVVKRYKEHLLSDETDCSLDEAILAMALRKGVLSDEDILDIITEGFSQ